MYKLIWVRNDGTNLHEIFNDYRLAVEEWQRLRDAVLRGEIKSTVLVGNGTLYSI